MRQSLTRWGLVILFIALAVSFGCGKRGEVEKGGAVGGARLIIHTDGYLPSAPGLYRRWVTGGLGELGDINNDGYTDLLVGSGKYPGSFAAYSGKDGEEIWQVKALVGKAAQAAGEPGYTLKDFALIGDQNGDGIPEIFVRNDWSDKEAFIFSGRDGLRILRAETGRTFTPVRVYDVTGDGVDDLVFIYGYELGVRALSAKDLSETLKKENLLQVDPKLVWQEWLVPSFPDLNGDGIDDYLVGSRDQEKSEWIFLSGKDFTALRRVPVKRDIVVGTIFFASPGDLNSEGTPDLIITNNMGADVNKDVSYLALYSGADGTQIWQVAGSSLPGGPCRIAVDAKTGERRELPGDVGFGAPVTLLSDLDGDGAREIACALPTIVGKKPVHGVLIFSGATGEHLTTLTLGPKQGYLRGDQMLFLASADHQATAALAVSGTTRDKGYMVAIFDLPKIKK